MSEWTLYDLMTESEVKPLDKFHNTTSLSGDNLKQRQIRAGSQNEAILKYFRSHLYSNFTAYELWQIMRLPMTPITSIRRALTDLTKLGYLLKTDIKRLGEYGELTFAWKLK
jgi:Fe2+ or Zn2+ uptake regulation protein